jgi:hypothetical protein
VRIIRNFARTEWIMKPTPQTSPPIENCPSTRLAASELVTVDRCSCGTLRVHLGALTLRVTPDALHGIMHTLGEALIANAGLGAQPRLPARMALGKLPRGQS